MTASQDQFIQSSPAIVSSLQPIVAEVASMPAIVARQVGMVFQTKAESIEVLRDVNLDVARGEVLLLMGPTGSGKTTLLSILAGMLTPTAGQVKILGQDLTQLSREESAQLRRQTIGFAFQEFNLLRALTASENIEVALTLKGIQGAEAQRQARLLLEQVKLGDKGDQLPRQLSGGQQQRVAIARAMAGNPPILMADEPTASLDSCNGHHVVSLMRQLARHYGSTVIIVSHDYRIQSMGDRIIHLEDGVLTTERI